MAIAKMDHFNLYTMTSDTDDILDTLQEFGDVHITDLREDEAFSDEELNVVHAPADIGALQEETQRVEKLIELLTEYEPEEGAFASLKKGNQNLTYDEMMAKGKSIDTSQVYEEIHRLTDALENNNQQIKVLKDDISELMPWKDLKYTLDELDYTETDPNAKVVFYTGSIMTGQYEYFMKELENFEYTYLEVINKTAKNVYILIASEIEEYKSEVRKILRKYSFFDRPFKSKGTPEDEIVKREKKITALEKDNKEINNSIAEYISELDDLKVRYEYLNALLAKYETSDNMLATKKVNIVEGYIETKQTDEFSKLLETNFPNRFFLDIEHARESDPNVPVKLKNNKFVEPFETITEMYATPIYGEIDPTPFLAPFYWLFFGMMIGDIGYGILLLLGTGAMLKCNLSDSFRKSVKFFFYLSFASILWGAIYGSFFGGIIDIPGLIDPEVDYTLLIIISLILGGIIMFLGLGLQAYVDFKKGQPLTALYDVFSWYMVVIGIIYLLLSHIFGWPGGTVAKYIMFAGMILILAFGGREADSIGGRIGMGAYELYGITSWIGDFVSFLRLMALGLSGAFIGLAVNMIVSLMFSSGIGGIIGGVVVFIFGQLLNLGLSALSAYVHTLRLIFVEFFGKFYTGGGIKYENIRHDAKYINVKK